MSFQPVLPSGGYTGWQFLQRTLEKQSTAHATTRTAQRDETYYREKIGQISSAEELVKDRRLLRVTLAAFGLADDLPNRAYITRVLESPTENDPESGKRSFVNRLADKRYLELSKAFGFGDGDTPLNKAPGFADKMIANYHARQFEVAVGEQDQSMRMALALQRDLRELAGSDQSENGKWFRVLGTPALRQVFETAFNLPKSFGTLDLDRQADIMRTRTQRMFGDSSVSQFSDPDQVNLLVRRFFVGEQLSQIQSSGVQSAALTMLQSAQANMVAFRNR